MSATFVSSLRSRREAIRLAPAGAPVLTIRVQIPEIWDVVRLEVSPDDTVRDVKRAALAALKPKADPEQFVMKLRGFEMLDESQALRDVDARDGSIFLLTHRRRRPVK